MSDIKSILGNGVFLEAYLVACVQHNGKKQYFPCQYWDVRKEPYQVLFFLNSVTIEGNPGQELKISVKDRNGILKPFFERNGLKRFSSRNVLTVEVENLRYKTARIFKIFRTDDNGTKTIHMDSLYKNYLGNQFSQKMNLAPVLEKYEPEEKIRTKSINSRTNRKKKAIDPLERKAKACVRRNRRTEDELNPRSFAGTSLQEAQELTH